MYQYVCLVKYMNLKQFSRDVFIIFPSQTALFTSTSQMGRKLYLHVGRAKGTVYIRARVTAIMIHGWQPIYVMDW